MVYSMGRTQFVEDFRETESKNYEDVSDEKETTDQSAGEVKGKLMIGMASNDKTQSGWKSRFRLRLRSRSKSRSRSWSKPKSLFVHLAYGNYPIIAGRSSFPT